MVTEDELSIFTHREINNNTTTWYTNTHIHEYGYRNLLRPSSNHFSGASAGLTSSSSTSSTKGCTPSGRAISVSEGEGCKEGEGRRDDDQGR